MALKIKGIGYFSGINKPLNIFYFECVFIINLCVQTQEATCFRKYKNIGVQLHRVRETLKKYYRSISHDAFSAFPKCYYTHSDFIHFVLVQKLEGSTVRR